MGRTKRQRQYCQSIAKKRKIHNDTNETNLDEILNSDDGESSEDEVGWIDDQNG